MLDVEYSLCCTLENVFLNEKSQLTVFMFYYYTFLFISTLNHIKFIYKIISKDYEQISLIISTIPLSIVISLPATE